MGLRKKTSHLHHFVSFELKWAHWGLPPWFFSIPSLPFSAKLRMGNRKTRLERHPRHYQLYVPNTCTQRFKGVTEAESSRDKTKKIILSQCVSRTI